MKILFVFCGLLVTPMIALGAKRYHIINAESQTMIAEFDTRPEPKSILVKILVATFSIVKQRIIT
jgi:hypothetical protein